VTPGNEDRINLLGLLFLHDEATNGTETARGPKLSEKVAAELNE
jgi:hypothetical protein